MISLKRLLHFYSAKSFIKSQSWYPVISLIYIKAKEQQAHNLEL
jgi:hypothetical protein